MSVIQPPARLFGRDREREQLHAALHAARDGRGALVLVSGEAGIGKTSLVRDASLHAQKLGMGVAIGGSYDLSTTPPYGPWVEILQYLLEPGAQLLLDTSRHSTSPTSSAPCVSVAKTTC